ncbi:hypothetical protein [Streptomyces hypolithicus]
MGIESDQLVYDFLSRVGDLAQQHKLPSGARMRLVSTLREEIDRQRSRSGPDSPAAVRRILGRMGSPAELVRAAASSGGDLPGFGRETDTAPPRVVLPEQRDRSAALDKLPGPDRPSGREKPSSPERSASPDKPPGRGRRIPRPRGREHRRPDTDMEVWDPSPPALPSSAASPPHLAGTDELGSQGSEPDWWRVEPGPFGMGVDVPGFVGGVEIPEILRPPPDRDAQKPAETAADTEADSEADTKPGQGSPPAVPAPRASRWWRPRLRRTAPVVAQTVVVPAPRRPVGVLLLLAAALLVAGAVLGNWLALGGGWLLAYASRRISRAEAKWVVLGLPGLIAAGGLVWLWGRGEGRWGEPIAPEAMGEAFAGMWPVLVRTAAVASALYLVWRARRR